MPYRQNSAAGLRHLMFLALLGVAVVFLAGPVIAVASVVLSLVLGFGIILVTFAAIGLLVWAPAYYLYAGREAAHEKFGGMGRSLGQALRQLTRVGVQAVALPIRVTSRLFRGGLHVTKITAHFIGEVGLVALTGAAIGAALGFSLSAINHQDPAQVVPLNTAVGGGIAAVVGVVLAFTSRRSTPRRLTA